MDTLAEQQLPSGEMPSFRRDADGRWCYGLNVLVSTLVHDALGSFDPGSPSGESPTSDLLHPEVLPRFLAQVTRIRRRLRDFIAWQEEAHGGWRAAGRGSSGTLDPETTALAAAALMESVPRSRREPWRRHLEALANLGVDFLGGTLEGRARAHLARLWALAGEASPRHLEDLVQRIAKEDRPGLDPRDAMAMAHAVARIYRHGLVPGRAVVAEILAPRILAWRGENDLLMSSLAITALLDLGCTEFELGNDDSLLLDATTSTPGWEEGYGLNGPSSPALTLALALASLARWTLATGGLPDAPR